MAGIVNAPDGILLIDKHEGVTSHDIVGKVRKLFGTRAVGHAGTLDPMATGVLVVLLGRAAKASEYLTGCQKRYIARLRLGLFTDTQDITGTVLGTSALLPDRAKLDEALEHFRGNILQVPPMYSALKVNGHKLVDLARNGVEIDREARPITVYSLQAEPTDTSGEYTLDCTVSGGTYIRTLCHDIGAFLGCGGAMAALRRVSACGFSVEQTYTVAELEAMEPEERLACLLPTEQIFADLKQVVLPAFFDRLICNGCAVEQKKLGIQMPDTTRLRLCHPDGSFFALGEVQNGALKAIKFFVL